MKVLIDTNVLISWVINSGRNTAPSQVVRYALEGVFTLIVSKAVLDEMENNLLNKPALARLVDPLAVPGLMAILRSSGTPINRPVGAQHRPISRDADDDIVLLDAAFAGAEYLVTGDRDLLVLETFAGVRIISPADFVDLIERTH